MCHITAKKGALSLPRTALERKGKVYDGEGAMKKDNIVVMLVSWIGLSQVGGDTTHKH